MSILQGLYLPRYNSNLSEIKFYIFVSPNRTLYAFGRAFWSFRLTCVVPPQITRHNHYLHIGQVGLPYFSRGSFKYLPLFLSCGVSHIFRIFFFFFTYPIFIFFCAHLKKSTTPNYKHGLSHHVKYLNPNTSTPIVYLFIFKSIKRHNKYSKG